MKATFRYQLFAHIVDTSGAADALTAALRTSPRGRPMNGSPRTFLILLLLAAADGELTIERMHQIATRELPRNIQLELGTVRHNPNPDEGGAGDRLVDMPIHELYYLSRTITRKLSWTATETAAAGREPISGGERERDLGLGQRPQGARHQGVDRPGRLGRSGDSGTCRAAFAVGVPGRGVGHEDRQGRAAGQLFRVWPARVGPGA